MLSYLAGELGLRARLTPAERIAAEGMTPLMLAARNDRPAEVQRLVAAGAKVDELSRYGWTALIFASWQGRLESVQILLNAGADVNVVSKPVPSSFETVSGHPSCTALQQAIRHGHVAIARVLIEGGARIDPIAIVLAGELGEIDFLSYLKQKGADLNADAGNRVPPSPLHGAAERGHLAAVEWLVANGADPNRIAVGQTALRAAVMNDRPAVVRFLLEHGAKANLEYSYVVSSQETALFAAVSKFTHDVRYAENLAIIEMLLSHGADTGFRSRRENYTPVQFAEVQRISLLKTLKWTMDQQTRERIQRAVAHHDAVIALLKKHGA